MMKKRGVIEVIWLVGFLLAINIVKSQACSGPCCLNLCPGVLECPPNYGLQCNCNECGCGITFCDGSCINVPSVYSGGGTCSCNCAGCGTYDKCNNCVNIPDSSTCDANPPTFNFISVKYADPKGWDKDTSTMRQGETRTVTAKMKNCFVLGDWTEYGLITTVSPDCTRAMTSSGQELALYPWASGMWQTNSFDVGQNWGTYSHSAWRQDFDLIPNLVNLYDIGWPPLVEANDVNVYYWSKENNWKCVINYPSCVPDASASMRIYGAFSIGIDVYGNRVVYIIGRSKTDSTDMRIWKSTQDYKNWEPVSPQDFHPLSGRLQVFPSAIYTIRDGRLATYYTGYGFWHDVGSSGVMNSFHVFSENDYYILSTDGNIWRYYYDVELGYERWAQITSGFSISYFTFKDDNPNDVYVVGSGVIKGQQVSMAHWDGSKWTALGTRAPCYERIKALNDGNKVRLFGLHCSGTAEHFPDYLEIEQDDWGIKKVFMPFSQYLYAGETVDLSFDITAPNTAGCYSLSGTMFTSYGTITDGARMYYYFPRPTYGGQICVEGICGNGIQEWDEQCDNGPLNGPYPAECSTSCAINPGPLCGNGIKEGKEECDNGGNNGPYPAECSTICKINLPPPVPVLIPDLTSTTPSILAGMSKAGRNLTFTGKIVNSGNKSVVDRFSNTFTVYDRNIVVAELGGGVIRSLNPKERFPLVSKKWVNVPVGTYRIVLCADSTNKVNEADETNNCNETSITIFPSVEDCADNIDNDGDGFTDCDDSDCDGTISGTVKDKDTSQPISGADVDVLQGLSKLISLTTDSIGNYNSNMKCGSYTLSASYPKYITNSKSITLSPNGNLITDFNLALGTNCESDCTFYEDNLIHSSCAGINGCMFCDETSKKACEFAQTGWHRDYDATHYVVCASGCPQLKRDEPATVTCQSGKTLVKVARIMVYNGKPVKLTVAICG